MSRNGAVFLFLVLAAAVGNIANANKEAQESSNSFPTRRAAVVAVDCYDCVSCPKVTDKTNTKKCPYNPDVLKIKNCVKYAEKYPTPINGKNVSWVIRGCASERGSCDDIKKAYLINPELDLEYCTECDGDKCNGVSRSLSDKFFAFFAVILVPIFGKYIFT